MTATRQPQELFGEETLEQALRQLTLYDHDWLPVVSTTDSTAEVGSHARTYSRR